METLTLTKNEIYSGNLILVNAKLPIVSHKTNEVFSLTSADIKYPDILMAHHAATILSHILCDIGCADEIIPVSGYRSEKEQKQIYADSLQDNGAEFTQKYVALPNHSEHQTGLAIDLGLKKDCIDFLRPDFPYDGICQKFRLTAPKYGFIERYQSGKESITGISHEPWHFRYVGYPHSEIMSNNHLSLEEYIETIKQFTYNGSHLEIKANGKNTEIFYIPFNSSDKLTVTDIIVPSNALYQVSGNNMDGFIVTLWR